MEAIYEMQLSEDLSFSHTFAAFDNRKFCHRAIHSFIHEFTGAKESIFVKSIKHFIHCQAQETRETMNIYLL